MGLKVRLLINLLPADSRPSGFGEVTNEGSGRFAADSEAIVVAKTHFH